MLFDIMEITKQDIEALTVFLNTFNRRPDHNLFFSEKLLTFKQLDDYETASAKLNAFYREQESKKENKK